MSLFLHGPLFRSPSLYFRSYLLSMYWFHILFHLILIIIYKGKCYLHFTEEKFELHGSLITAQWFTPGQWQSWSCNRAIWLQVRFLFTTLLLSLRKFKLIFILRLMGNTLRYYNTKVEITHDLEISLIWQRGWLRFLQSPNVKYSI